MRWWFLLFFFLMAGFSLCAIFFRDPGYMVIAFQSWSVEMPLWLSCVALFCLYAALNIVVFLMRWILGWSKKWQSFREKWQEKKIREQSKGLMNALWMQDSSFQINQTVWKSVFDLKQAMDLNCFSIWLYIHQGHYQKAMDLIKKHPPSFAIEILMAECWIEQKNYQEALSLLDQILQDNLECLSERHLLYKKAMLLRSQARLHLATDQSEGPIAHDVSGS